MTGSPPERRSTISACTGCATSRRRGACSPCATRTTPATRRRCARSTRARTTCRPGRRRSSAGRPSSPSCTPASPATRLLTIAGPGGSGKTRLVAQLAAEQAGRWPDGVWWVELGALVDPAQVAGRGRRRRSACSSIRPAGVVGSLRAQLAGAAAAALPRQLRARARRGRRAWPSALRDCPDVSLARHEPRAARPGRRGGVAAVAAAAAGRAGAVPRARPPRSSPTSRSTTRPTPRSRRCAPASTASPLALELAAAWLRTLTPRQIEAGLDDRFSLLVRSPRDAVPRHASLLALDGLEPRPARRGGPRRVPPARGVRRRLRPRRGAGGVRGGGGRGRRRHGRDRAAGRQVARRRAGRRRRGCATGCRRRSGSTPRTGCGRRASELPPPTATSTTGSPSVRDAAPDLERDKDRWRTALARDHDNLRAAIDHGLEADDPSAARRLAAELPWLWHLHRQGREGMQILRRAIARAPDERSVLQARLLAGIALVADTAGSARRRARRREPGRRARRRARRRALLALCLALAAVGRFYTDLDGARETSLEAERIAERAGDAFVVDAGRALRGILLHLRDEHAEAQALLSEAAERLTARGDRGVGSTALAFQSGSALLTGDLRGARELAEQSIATAAPLADHLRIGMGRSALALALGAGGDVPAGLAALAPVLPLVAGADTRRSCPRSGARSGRCTCGRATPRQALGWLAAEAALDRRRPADLPRRPRPAGARRRAAADRPGRGGGGDRRARGRARPRARDARRAGRRPRRAGAPARGEDEAALDLHHEALAIRADHGLRAGVVESLEALAALGTGHAGAGRRGSWPPRLPPRRAVAAGRPSIAPTRRCEALRASWARASTRRGARAPRSRSTRRRPTPAAPAAPAAAPTTAGRASRRPSSRSCGWPSTASRTRRSARACS